VVLPQAIGVRRAVEMSLTGNFLSAQDARSLGLVNHVVPHDRLREVAVGLARDVAGIDPAAIQHLLATYRMTTSGTVGDAFRIEVDQARVFGRGFDHTTVAAKREAIRSRGRGQLPS
jgi:enoyl-CoA hydratase